jgi:lipopolysaccharide biosynthesis regulator YciM
VDPLIEILTKIDGRVDALTLRAYGMGLVDALARAGKPTRAECVLGMLLQRDPTNAEGLRRLASIAVTAGDWRRAAETQGRLVRALATEDHDTRAAALLAYADACVRAGSPGDARSALEQALAERPDAALESRLQTIYERTEDWERLARLLDSRAERVADPVKKAALLLDAAIPCATLHLARGRFEVAIDVLTGVVERTAGKRMPQLADVYLLLAKAHLALDAIVEAFEALNAGFGIAARSREHAMLLGLVAIDLGEHAIAERALIAVTMLASKATDETAVADRRTAFHHLAACAREKGDVARARRWAAEAQRLEEPVVRRAAAG